MTAANILNPNDPDLERFLYALVGEDSGGHSVSVLSILARLKLDPWEEAAALAALSREAAEQRLGQLLARCLDVPALGRDPQAVARSLAPLLPNRGNRRDMSGAITRTGPMMSWSTILTIFVLGYVLIQTLFTGDPGAGD